MSFSVPCTWFAFTRTSNHAKSAIWHKLAKMSLCGYRSGIIPMSLCGFLSGIIPMSLCGLPNAYACTTVSLHTCFTVSWSVTLISLVCHMQTCAFWKCLLVMQVLTGLVMPADDHDDLLVFYKGTANNWLAWDDAAFGKLLSLSNLTDSS